jgi:hypothetical protein
MVRMSRPVIAIVVQELVMLASKPHRAVSAATVTGMAGAESRESYELRARRVNAAPAPRVPGSPRFD